MNATTSIELSNVESTEAGALALITLSPEKYAAEVYQPFKATLASAIDSVRAVEYDITTTAGMASAIKCRALFRDMRVAADKERKARKEPITKIGKLLESGFDQVEERIAPLELMFDAEITTENARKEAEKAAKIAAERQRTEAIQADIETISDLVFDVAGKDAAAIGAAIDQAAQIIVTAERFAEFTDDATDVIASTIEKLSVMRDAALASEQAAHAAEQARIAESARLEAERAELARLRADAERIANEQAAERQRLADLAAAQELAAKQLRDKAAANLQAERDAQAEQMRIERERVAAEQAKAAAEIKAQQDKLAEQQAAADARDAAALAAQQDAKRRDDDHGPALEMNAMFDAAIVACARFPEVLAEQAREEAEINADLARCTETAQAMLTNGRSLVQPESYSERDAMIDAADGMDSEPTDIEIIDVYVENFGGTRSQAVARLLAFAGDEVAGTHYSTTTFKDNGDPILLNADGSRSIFCDVDE